VIAQGAKTGIREGVPLVAELLHKAGYFTAAADNLGRWFSRGFDEYEGYSWEMPKLGPWRKAEAVNTTALGLVDRLAAQSRPFFGFIHYWDAHTPYLPPAPFDRMFYSGDERDPENASMDPVWDYDAFKYYFAEWLPGVTDVEYVRAQYDASIAYLDHCLGTLLSRLEERGLLESTTVIITADHGEEMDEHGCWFDHHGLYDTNIHIPLIMSIPGMSRPGIRVPGFVRTLDITPTILDLAGLDAPQVQGTSVLPMLAPHFAPVGGTCDELYLTECTWMRKRALRTRRFKYIMALEPDLHGKPEEELYDLLLDPGETVNLAEEQPERCAELRARLIEWSEKRADEAGQADPLETNSISLRQIGNPETPILKRPGGDSYWDE